MMEELERILREHAKRYPKMQPTDAVKLIYQNEFGGGHLIRDDESCLNYLRREYESVQREPNALLYENIGNGIVRVNLAAVKSEDLEHLGRSFIRSASEHIGSIDCFLKKLELLCKLTSEGIFSFGTQEMKSYMTQYEKAGYPMVSHSEQYRQAYEPSYRIVRMSTF